MNTARIVSQSDWAKYWRLRTIFENQATQIATTGDMESVETLIVFLEDYCFGCCADIHGSPDELCDACRERQVWALN